MEVSICVLLLKNLSRKGKKKRRMKNAKEENLQKLSIQKFQVELQIAQILRSDFHILKHPLHTREENKQIIKTMENYPNYIIRTQRCSYCQALRFNYWTTWLTS